MQIFDHSTCLAAELVRRLGALVHENGKPVVRLYGQWGCFTGKDDRHPGPSVAFNIYGCDGSPVGYDEVSRLASLNRPPIQLRTGCFCNPGACQTAIPLSCEDVLRNYSSGHVCGDRRGVLNGKPTGAIRASFGKDSTWEDMDALVVFVERVFVSRGDELVRNRNSSESEVNVVTHLNSSMKIESLFVFPIKSCAAMKVNRWPVSRPRIASLWVMDIDSDIVLTILLCPTIHKVDRRSGRLAYDREFALVDASGSTMRLYSHPQMSRIHATIDLRSKIMTIAAPNHDDLSLSLENVGSKLSPQDVEVCGLLCKGCVFGGGRASIWFSSVLGVRCWLARYHEVGRTDPSSHNSGHAYSNEASLLVVSQQSVSYLNSVIAAQGWGKLVESRHFRPNIVVSALTGKQVELTENDANPEDSWEKITIRGNTDVVELKAAGLCARCRMVDIDPSSGMRGNTLRALAQYRRDKGRINFGIFFNGSSDAPKGDVWIEEGSIVDVC
jgi:molybdenum cofactor sulfurtransferase